LSNLIEVPLIHSQHLQIGLKDYSKIQRKEKKTHWTEFCKGQPEFKITRQGTVRTDPGGYTASSPG
jgi:hypothetical protein